MVIVWDIGTLVSQWGNNIKSPWVHIVTKSVPPDMIFDIVRV